MSNQAVRSIEAIGLAATRDRGEAVLARFESVYKTYDEQNWVVDNLCLDIRQGEFLSLLGPSGSGKTTTLMMLAGFELPDQGRIFLDGRDISALPAYRRDMGVVFQSYALFPHMSVLQNVEFPLQLRGVRSREARTRALEALALVRMDGLAGRSPQQLSGGQQQRVALARALVYRPRILLMDEPLGALDKALREHMQLELKALHRELGITFVYVTHDQDEAMTLSDRVALFHQGKIAQIDSPERIYKRPISSFVASFLGETNLLSGAVVQRHETIARMRLDEGGAEFDACCNDPSVEVGHRAVLAVRPESLGLAEVDHPAIEVTVADTVFHGAHSTLHLMGSSGSQMTMKFNPATRLTEFPRRLDRLRVTFRADDATVLKETANEMATSP